MTEAALHVADSITKLGPAYRDAVLVAGSHGGRYCGYLAALAGLRGVVLNDAGIGRDRAGVGALEYLAALGAPAAVVDYRSARIGDGHDMLTRGTLSACNDAATALGCASGQACREAAARLGAGPSVRYPAPVPAYQEARVLIDTEDGPIVLCDSASLIDPEADAGAVVVTGSHGGILAGRPGYGVAAPLRAAAFNDAGVGIDDAGIQRLPVLDEAGIVAVTVGAQTARIGDARSAWETGTVSHANTRAAALGIVAGMDFATFVQTVYSAR